MRALQAAAGAAVRAGAAEAPPAESARATSPTTRGRCTRNSFASARDGCTPRGRPSLRSPRMRVYFAGPLFTPYERAFIDEFAARLREAGIDVFVPHENALAAADTTAAAIFAKDLEGLAAADAV